jgi:hypothetical protein
VGSQRSALADLTNGFKLDPVLVNPADTVAMSATE